MRPLIVLLLPLLSLVSLDVNARDTTLHFSIEEAMASPDFQEKLNAGIKFYFGNQGYPEPDASRGEYVSNKKTNGFNKTEREACEWVLLSALLSLQERALAEGGNAVVDIVSYYKKKEFSSETEYECHDGTFITGVALKGRVVTLP